MSRPGDVVVVGNGVLGLMAARQVLIDDPSAQVVVVGPRSRPAGATVAAGAMLGLWGEVTKYTFKDAPQRARFALCRAADDLWPAVLDDLALAPCARGTFVVSNAASGRLDDDNWAALIAALVDNDVPHDMVEPRDIAGLTPAATGRALRAVHMPDEHALDAGALLGALEADLTVRGGRIVDAEVTELIVGSEAVTGVATSDGSLISAGTVVVAAGAATTPLLEAALGEGACMPIVAGAGTSVVARRTTGIPFEQVVRTVNRAGSCGLHVVPRGAGVEYFGATNIVFRRREEEATLGMSGFLLDCVTSQLARDAFFHRVLRWHTGNRPVPLDMLPLIGPGPVDGLVVASGTYRDGLHASPEIARLVSASVRGEHSGGPFAPRRPPAFPLTSADESVAELALQGLSGSYENDLRLPGFVPETAIEEWFARQARTVFDRLERDRGLPVDLLHFLALDRLDDTDVDWVRRSLDRLPAEVAATDDDVDLA